MIHDAVRNLTYSDWRLPTLNDLSGPGCNYSYSGSDCGYNVDAASSELAHLYYVAFGNKALVNGSGQQQFDHGLIDDPGTPKTSRCLAILKPTISGSVSPTITRQVWPGHFGFRLESNIITLPPTA